MQPETGESERMARRDRRGEGAGKGGFGRAGERLHEPGPGRCIISEKSAGRVYGPLEQRRRAVVERMRERRPRMNELDPVLRERKRPQEGRSQRPRMDSRADVVCESGERQ